MSGVFARGKRSMSISDRSGMAFPYREMVKEWNGFLVHYSEYDNQRSTSDKVRFRGPPLVTSTGSGGADGYNKQQFATIPTFDNVSDISAAAGFTITIGKKNSDGSVTTAAGTLGEPENYFYFTSTSTATDGSINGGGDYCSAGPVTLGVVNG